ncbi:bifunctional 5,10-methylenetetrahydrofolate dehydrogenase/5,10-methenyltetrahydrofolate cyclohydrolase [Candidatus Uhrbacteria bacterium]|nr:bifunctional 5,10-methylenetetrahydrofolate dehydrogenase/5,10-methenyltetrahydrofolate cyclohydrolase [Candidatus Uhrbacteria bacterium]
MADTLLIDGQSLAEKIRLEVRRQIVTGKLVPQLAVVLVGDDPASHLYVSLKEKACKEVGIIFHKYLVEENTTEPRLLEIIDFLNKDTNIDAILIQLPLPKQLNEDKIIQALDPKKDVDGFHPENLRKFFAGKPYVVPGLAAGIWRLIQETGENLVGKKAIIVANSEIFAKPLIKILEDNKIQPEYVNSQDKNLRAKCRQADILIVAVGKPYFIDGDMIKSGCIIIDVGTNKLKNETVGDVDWEEINEIAGHVTPVPGGVGPMTIAMLLENVINLHQMKNK